jgi:hypothetical protein
VFNEFQITRDAILAYLDTRQEVKNWFAILPAGIIIISNRNAYQLSEILRQKFSGSLFIISEIPTGNNDGWLDQKAWSFINNPVSSGRWPEFS